MLDNKGPILVHASINGKETVVEIENGSACLSLDSIVEDLLSSNGSSSMVDIEDRLESRACLAVKRKCCFHLPEPKRVCHRTNSESDACVSSMENTVTAAPTAAMLSVLTEEERPTSTSVLGESSRNQRQVAITDANDQRRGDLVQLELNERKNVENVLEFSQNELEHDEKEPEPLGSFLLGDFAVQENPNGSDLDEIQRADAECGLTLSSVRIEEEPLNAPGSKIVFEPLVLTELDGVSVQDDVRKKTERGGRHSGNGRICDSLIAYLPNRQISCCDSLEQKEWNERKTGGRQERTRKEDKDKESAKSKKEPRVISNGMKTSILVYETLWKRKSGRHKNDVGKEEKFLQRKKKKKKWRRFSDTSWSRMSFRV